jgi:hypothetical protein
LVRVIDPPPREFGDETNLSFFPVVLTLPTDVLSKRDVVVGFVCALMLLMSFCMIGQ